MQRNDKGVFVGKTEEEFKHEFEQKFEQFEYYDKYTNTDKPFLMQCKECGHIQERNAQCLRRNKRVRCDGCTVIRIKAKEMERKKEAEERKQAREEKRRLAEIERDKPHSLICKNCGEPFESKRKKMYCSDKCLRKHRNREKENRKRMKELILKDSNLYDSSISLDKLIVRDKNICHICGRECDINDYEQRDDNTFIAGGNYPSIDHVIPLNKGGTHTWANVSLAHMWCNTIKSDKLTGTNMEHLELQDTLQGNDRYLA